MNPQSSATLNCFVADGIALDATSIYWTDDRGGIVGKLTPRLASSAQNAARAALMVSAMSTNDERTKIKNRTSILLTVACNRLWMTRMAK